MFTGCQDLQRVPDLNTSNGLLFNFIFYMCGNLVVKPVVDLSKAKYTNSMYEGIPFDESTVRMYQTPEIPMPLEDISRY